MCNRLARVTGKIYAFAEGPATLDAALNSAIFAYAWGRPHPAVRIPVERPGHRQRYRRRTSALAARVTD
jgi:hypothetical protein